MLSDVGSSRDNYSEGLDSYLKGMETRRDNALEKRDALSYFDAITALGYIPEDPLLYEQGMVEHQRQTRKVPGKTDGLVEAVSIEPKIAKIARIALMRFPELQLGERITTKEVRKRLGQIRDAGYEVPAYGKMNKAELWNTLSSLRKEIRGQANEECPDTLRDIDRKNQEAKDSAWYHR